MHNTKKAYLLPITLLQWFKKLAEILRVSHIHTTSATRFLITSSADEIAEIRKLAIPLGNPPQEVAQVDAHARSSRDTRGVHVSGAGSGLWSSPVKFDTSEHG